MTTLQRGDFAIQSLEDVQSMAFLLGSLLPQPELSVTGLYELLLNAVEHGNLGIGYTLKNQLLATGEWDAEVQRRLQLPENIAKHVIVSFVRHNSEIAITITDQGNGFDWRPFMELEPSRATLANGRGIAKANLLSFDSMAYRDNGRTVQIVCRIA